MAKLVKITYFMISILLYRFNKKTRVFTDEILYYSNTKKPIIF